jgi:hypothetical protein
MDLQDKNSFDLEQLIIFYLNHKNEFDFPECEKKLNEGINNLPSYQKVNLMDSIPEKLIEGFNFIKTIPIQDEKEKKFKLQLKLINLLLGKVFFDGDVESSKQKIMPTLIKIKREIEKELHRTDNPQIVGFNSTLEPNHKERLKAWIYSGSMETFNIIENELLNRKYLDEDYKWANKKTKLIDFLTVIHQKNFFRPIVLGKRKQLFHYRQFISEMYGYRKTGLTETSTKHKPTLNEALFHFSWIENHLNE